MAEQANLGLATTRELLEELQTRGETERFRNPDNAMLGDALQRQAGDLWALLPQDMLAYRTVDHA